jgi:hypothetical protein
MEETLTDLLCRICNEPLSAHVATEAGPFTHPREARGEGRYVLEAAGTAAESSPGAGDELEWERWKFIPEHKR